METAPNIGPLLNAYSRLPIQIARGEGSYLFDTGGKRYLDFAAGIAVTSLGHCHPHVVNSLKSQAEILWHSANLFLIPEQIRLAERLVEATFADRVFFCSSGLEAVETAIKLIRKAQHPNGKYRIITLENGFHGRSLGCLSAGGNAIAREGFGPLLEGFDTVPREDIAALEAAITPETAGILLEPIQAEGGVYPLSSAYLKQVRELTDAHNLLLAFDEVQCGYGRTGTLFAYQQADVTPDILTTAKGIGNGFPLAACLMTEAVASAITPGTHGSTYGGNPLAMAVGNAVLDVLQGPGFLPAVQARGHQLKAGLEALAKTHPEKIRAVRGEGLLLGVELQEGVSAKAILLACIEAGLVITRAAGDRVLRLVPPLTIHEAEVAEGLMILEKVLS